VKQPHSQCYWVKPGRLLAGEYPQNFDDIAASLKLQTILDAGMTQFVDLTEEKIYITPY
jgi:hypothetical protein